MNKQSIIISIVLGLVITTGSFFAVFGPSLKNLSKTPTEIPSPSTTTGSTSTTSTTGTASSGNGGVSTGYDEDDEEYDDDDYGGSTALGTTGTTTTGTSSTTGSSTTTGGTSGTTTPSGYTLAQISSHNSRTSCWSAINGNVYDLTSWVDSHPGGALTILTICGKDGSPFFNAQHGGKNKPANILAGFKIGVLK